VRLYRAASPSFARREDKLKVFIEKKTDFMPSKNFKLLSRTEDSINFLTLLIFMNSAIVIRGFEKRKKKLIN